MDEKKPLMEHLSELRKRIIFSAIAVAVGLIASYIIYDIVILNLVRAPLDLLSGREGNPFVGWSPIERLLESFRERSKDFDLDLHYIGPLEGFTVKLKVSLYCGILAAFPFIMYQLWRFVSVALQEKERRLFRVYFPSALVLFVVGILFAYFVTIPAGLLFLTNVSSELKPMFTISKYTSIVFMLMLVFGVVLELPLVILFLTRIGIVTTETLSKKRKYVILVIFVAAAVLTPPDVFTQLMLGIPVVILYEVSLWIAKLAGKKRTAGK